MLKYCSQIFYKHQNQFCNIARLASTTSGVPKINTNIIEPREAITQNNHCFKELFPWKNNRELVKYIIDEAIIYNNESLIAINKPYGLTNRERPKRETSKIIQTLNTSLCSNYDGNLNEILPLLAKELGVKELTVIRTPERYNSGVALLSSNDTVTEKIKQCFLRTQSSKALLEDMIAVTIGAPNQDKSTYLASLYLKTSEGSQTNKQAMLVEKLPKKAVERGLGKRINVQHETLFTNKETFSSLVKISPSSRSWHFVRIYLGCLLSPVLGDNVHGSRVTFNLSEPKAVNPLNHLAQLPQRIPPQILDALGLKKREESLVPAHLHQSLLRIPGFFNKKEDLVITAPLPEHFKWTCEKLKLELPSEFV